MAIVCFTSDFGLDDTWVGVCHAAIITECPDARVVDIALGIAPYDLRGESIIASLVPGPFGLCERKDDHVIGEVLESDRFGSLRLNVPSENLEVLGLSGDTLEIAIGHNTLKVPRGLTFSDVGEGEPVVVADSSGWLTLAVNQGSASDRYGICAGARVVLRTSL